MSVEELQTELERRGLLDVLDDVAADHHVSRAEVLGRTRPKTIVAARRTFARELRELGMSYPEIGRLIGRDHSTVMALIRDDDRPRCAMCEGLFDDHLSRPPHMLPARGCLGFAPRAAEAG